MSIFTLIVCILAALGSCLPQIVASSANIYRINSSLNKRCELFALSQEVQAVPWQAQRCKASGSGACVWCLRLVPCIWWRSKEPCFTIVHLQSLLTNLCTDLQGLGHHFWRHHDNAVLRADVPQHAPLCYLCPDW